MEQVVLPRVLGEVAVCLVLFDLLLGASHCVLHSKHFYAYHKKHHQIKADLPIGSWYMSAVDMVMELWIPIFVPPLLLGMSWLGLWVWLLIVEFDGVHSHAGLDFCWPIPGPHRHYLHHALLTKNFSNGILDAILDTEAKEVKSTPQEQDSQTPASRKCRSCGTPTLRKNRSCKTLVSATQHCRRS